MSRSLLITRPNHDPATNLLFHWSGPVLAEAQRKHIQAFDLFGEKATRKNFESYCKAHIPKLIFLNGHGNAECVMGWDTEVVVDTASSGSLFGEAILFARSCDSALKLGRTMIRKGLTAFIGYTRKYIAAYTRGKEHQPLSDKLAALFIEPSNLIVTTILKGHTAKEANDRSKLAMIKNFRYMLSSAATYEEQFASRWMWSNIKSQVLLGDENATF